MSEEIVHTYNPKKKEELKIEENKPVKNYGKKKSMRS
jgi:hypothetical protein